MKCPHCLVEFHASVSVYPLGQDPEGHFEINRFICSSCSKLILFLHQYKTEDVQLGHGAIKRKKTTTSNLLFRPKAINRSPVPPEVPVEYAIDYKEACLVLTDSPKASAALSRRCLQHIIRNNLGITKKDLFQEIQEVIDTACLPADILESIDSVRNIGNFTAHPIKSQSTGEIVEVEPEEADWNLDVLEILFEFLFVRPEIIKKKRAELNRKLSDAAKKDMQ